MLKHRIAACAWVRDFLAGFPPKNFPVRPVIVVHVGGTEADGDYPGKVMSAKSLTTGSPRDQKGSRGRGEERATGGLRNDGQREVIEGLR